MSEGSSNHTVRSQSLRVGRLFRLFAIGIAIGTMIGAVNYFIFGYRVFSAGYPTAQTVVRPQIGSWTI